MTDVLPERCRHGNRIYLDDPCPECERDALRAENTRLRTVLDRIAYGKYHWEVDLQEEARAALGTFGNKE